MDEIWDLIESVSKGFPTYFYVYISIQQRAGVNSKDCILNLPGHGYSTYQGEVMYLLVRRYYSLEHRHSFIRAPIF